LNVTGRVWKFKTGGARVRGSHLSQKRRERWGTLLLLVSAIKPTDHYIVKIKFKLKLKLKLKGLTPSTALRAGFLAEGREKDGATYIERDNGGAAWPAYYRLLSGNPGR
jgi:hypothetical protein